MNTTDILKLGFEDNKVIISKKRFFKKKNGRFNFIIQDGKKDLFVSFYDNRIQETAEFIITVKDKDALQKVIDLIK